MSGSQNTKPIEIPNFYCSLDGAERMVYERKMRHILKNITTQENIEKIIVNTFGNMIGKIRSSKRKNNPFNPDEIINLESANLDCVSLRFISQLHTLNISQIRELRIFKYVFPEKQFINFEGTYENITKFKIKEKTCKRKNQSTAQKNP